MKKFIAPAVVVDAGAEVAGNRDRMLTVDFLQMERLKNLDQLPPTDAVIVATPATLNAQLCNELPKVKAPLDIAGEWRESV